MVIFIIVRKSSVSDGCECEEGGKEQQAGDSFHRNPTGSEFSGAEVQGQTYLRG
jgi:hypothetical protein